MRSPSRPIIFVIAGCNGAGKTTFAKSFLPNEAKCLNFLNADLLAQGLSPLNIKAAAIKAGRLLLGNSTLLWQTAQLLPLKAH